MAFALKIGYCPLTTISIVPTISLLLLDVAVMVAVPTFKANTADPIISKIDSSLEV